MATDEAGVLVLDAAANLFRLEENTAVLSQTLATRLSRLWGFGISGDTYLVTGFGASRGAPFGQPILLRLDSRSGRELAAFDFGGAIATTENGDFWLVETFGDNTLSLRSASTGEIRKTLILRDAGLVAGMASRCGRLWAITGAQTERRQIVEIDTDHGTTAGAISLSDSTVYALAHTGAALVALGQSYLYTINW